MKTYNDVVELCRCTGCGSSGDSKGSDEGREGSNDE